MTTPINASNQYQYLPPLPAPGPAKPNTSRTGPRIMLAIGATFLVLTIAAVVVAIPGFNNMTNETEVQTLKDSDGGSAVGDLDKSVTLNLEADTSHGLYEVCETASETSLGADDFKVVDPDGSEMLVVSNFVSFTSVVGGETWLYRASFTAPRDGLYEVSITDSGHTESFGVGKIPNVIGFTTGLLGTVGGVLIAVFVGVPALGLTVGGAAWLAVRKKNYKQMKGNMV